MSLRLYDDVTEAEFQQQIFDALHLCGWKVAHFRPARTSSGWVTPVQEDGAGWPDVFAVHPRTGDAFAAELKTEKGRVSAAQAEWLAWLEVCGLGGYLWRPSMIDDALQRINKPRRAMTRHEAMEIVRQHEESQR